MDLISIFISFLLFLAFCCSIIIISFVLKNNAVKKWYKVKGEISYLSLEESNYTFMEDSENFGPTNSISYRLKVIYTYQVDNKIYHSSKVYSSYFRNIFMSDVDKKQIKKRLSNKESLFVFINPKNHKQSAIIKKIKFYDFVFLTILFLAMSILLSLKII